jgi:hypothetical protein
MNKFPRIPLDLCRNILLVDSCILENLLELEKNRDYTNPLSGDLLNALSSFWFSRVLEFSHC